MIQWLSLREKRINAATICIAKKTFLIFLEIQHPLNRTIDKKIHKPDISGIISEKK